MTYRHPQRSVQRWYSTAINAGWKASEWAWLSHIIWRESGGDPRAYNPERQARTPRGWGSYGLTQIYTYANRDWLIRFLGRDMRGLFNPRTNLRAARKLYEMRGRRPWG